MLSLLLEVTLFSSVFAAYSCPVPSPIIFVNPTIYYVHETQTGAATMHFHRGTKVLRDPEMLRQVALMLSQNAESISDLSRASLTFKVSQIDLAQVKTSELASFLLQNEAVEKSEGIVLVLSNKHLYDDGITAITDVLMEQSIVPITGKVEALDLENNEIGIEGLQALIPFLSLPNVKYVNLSRNRIDGEDLFEKFGRDQAYSEYTDPSEKIFLDDQTRNKLLQKIIWIPQSFFDPQDTAKNPSGMYVTPVVIEQHRTYYGLSR